MQFLSPKRPLLLCILLATIGITSCKKAPDLQKPKPLRVGYIPIAECLPLFVAKEMGFFDRHNIEVELTSIKGGALIIQGIGANQLDAGFSNVVSLVLNTAEGQGLRSFYGGTYETERNQNHSLYVRSDIEGKTTAETLRGRTIAINTRKNIEQLMLEKYMDTLGLKFGVDYKVQEIAFPDMLQQLEAKNVDAVCIVEPFIAAASALPKTTARALGNHYLATQRIRTVVATYLSNDTRISDRHDDLARFAAAMADATAFIRANESKSREILPRFTKMSNDQAMKIGLAEFTDSIKPDDLSPIVEDIVRFGYLGGTPAPPPKSLIIEIK